MALLPPPTQATRHLGQPAGLAPHLGPGLPADHRLKIPDDHGIGVRPAHGTQDVVGVAHVGDPIPDGVVHGVLQGAAAGLHRHHLGPQQTMRMTLRRWRRMSSVPM